MAHGGKRRRSGGGGKGLPSARVEWLPEADSPTQGTLSSGTQSAVLTMYNFTGAAKYADNYGAGDWTIERFLATLACVSVDEARPAKLVKVCVGVGMMNTDTSVGTASAGSAGSPGTQPELSWLIMLCCFVNLTNGDISECHMDGRARRRISPSSRLVSVVETTGLAAGDLIDYELDTRILVRQRGSRL